MTTPAPSHFSSLLQPENIICNLQVDSYPQALKILLNLLEPQIPNFDTQTILRELIVRERLAPTMVYPGVVLPHLRLSGLPKLVLAAGTSPSGIALENSEQRAHVIFLVLTPQDDLTAYLQFLAGISKQVMEISKEHGDVRLIVGCATPKELCAALALENAKFPKFISVMHLMDPDPITLLESDSLGKVIDTLSNHRICDIPVVDEQGDVRGVVSSEDLLRLSLPEHLLWMHDLTPIIDFEPFSDLLRKAREMNLADFMREEYPSIAPDAPAIQLAKMFLIEKKRQILVMNGQRLLGVVNLGSFISKLFWA